MRLGFWEGGSSEHLFAPPPPYPSKGPWGGRHESITVAQLVGHGIELSEGRDTRRPGLRYAGSTALMPPPGERGGGTSARAAPNHPTRWGENCGWSPMVILGFRIDLAVAARRRGDSVGHGLGEVPRGPGFLPSWGGERGGGGDMGWANRRGGGFPLCSPLLRGGEGLPNAT